MLSQQSHCPLVVGSNPPCLVRGNNLGTKTYLKYVPRPGGEPWHHRMAPWALAVCVCVCVGGLYGCWSSGVMCLPYLAPFLFLCSSLLLIKVNETNKSAQESDPQGHFQIPHEKINIFPTPTPPSLQVMFLSSPFAAFSQPSVSRACQEVAVCH